MANIVETVAVFAAAAGVVLIGVSLVVAWSRRTPDWVARTDHAARTKGDVDEPTDDLGPVPTLREESIQVPREGRPSV